MKSRRPLNESITVATAKRSKGVPFFSTPAVARPWFLVKLTLSLMLVGYLVIALEWSKVWDSVKTVSMGWMLLSLSYIPVGVVLIAARYHQLTNRLISLPAMIRLTIFQSAVSTFLANIAGSLSYIGILVKLNKVPLDLAVRSAIITRVVDMFAAVVVAGILISLAWDQLSPIHSLLVTAMLLSAGILILVLAAATLGRRLPIRPPALTTSRTIGPLWAFSQRTLNFCLRLVRLEPQYAASAIPKALLYSLLAQGVIAVSMYFNARAFDLQIGLLEAALVGVVSSFIASIPVTVFGGLGVYEVSTVGLLGVFGVPISESAAMVLVVRAIFFFVMALMFFFSRPPTDAIPR